MAADEPAREGEGEAGGGPKPEGEDGHGRDLVPLPRVAGHDAKVQRERREGKGDAGDAGQGPPD